MTPQQLQELMQRTVEATQKSMQKDAPPDPARTELTPEQRERLKRPQHPHDDEAMRDVGDPETEEERAQKAAKLQEAQQQQHQAHQAHQSQQQHAPGGQ